MYGRIDETRCGRVSNCGRVAKKDEGMKIRVVVIICVAALLIAVAVGVAAVLRNRRHLLPPPEVPLAASPAEVRVKAVERKAELVKRVNVALVSVIVAIV